MKKLITVLLVSFLFTKIQAQENFIYDFNGLSPKHLSVKVDNVSRNKIYTDILKWINITYKNPTKVIKEKVENEKITFSGVTDKYIKVKNFELSVRYTIQISLIDNEYKFQPKKLEYYMAGRWFPASFNYTDAYYKSSGKIRSTYKDFPPKISKLFNDIESMLNIYILKGEDVYKSLQN